MISSDNIKALPRNKDIKLSIQVPFHANGSSYVSYPFNYTINILNDNPSLIINVP